MAKPRVFVSSTYYDLRHIRSSLELFIESLGFEPVLSEKGDIAYTPDRPLDESCYREASSTDIFVLIIGGRYGSEASSRGKGQPHTFFERYESITKKEFDSAYNEDIPIYILIEAGVYSEYQTYLKNKGNERVNYAHVDSVNIFKLIEEILGKPRNNPLFAFERSSQIEGWLREQWAGFFRELLKSRSQQKQLSALTVQIGELKTVNETLKTYLEAMMRGQSKDAFSRLIDSEEKRLEEAKRLEKARTNVWSLYVVENFGVPFDLYIEAMREADSYSSFVLKIQNKYKGKMNLDKLTLTLRGSIEAKNAFNEVRNILGVRPINDEGSDASSGIDDRAEGPELKRKVSKPKGN